MADNPDITDKGKLDPLEGGKGPNTPEYTPDADAFAEHMKTSQEPSPLQQGNVPSPMDIASQQKIAPSTPPTMDSVREQMNSVSSSLGDIKSQLHTKGLKLKSSEKHLIRNKLGNANEHINTASSKLGVQPGDESNVNKSKNPITRFLAMVSDGQRQMVDAANTIKGLNASGQSVNPGDLLLVQIKLNKAQQELNYTSVILGNATSMIKTLFNIQI